MTMVDMVDMSSRVVLGNVRRVGGTERLMSVKRYQVELRRLTKGGCQPFCIEDEERLVHRRRP